MMEKIKYKEKKIIYMSGLDIHEVDSVKELDEILFGKEFEKLNEDKKTEKRLNMIKNIALFNDLKLTLKKNISKEINMYDKYIIIDDSILFYTTLAKNNLIKILVKKYSSIFFEEEEEEGLSYLKELEIGKKKYIDIKSRYEDILKYHTK